MEVIILAGGYGTRISEYTKRIPKPLIKIGKHPILYHIIMIYKKHGFNNFIVALGYKGNLIKRYFKKYKNVIYLSLRRQWVGQSSSSEHGRATGLANKPDNGPWVFKEIVGSPRTGWKSQAEFPLKDRRTVYMIFITVKP